MTPGLLPTGFRDRLPPHADTAARLEAAVLGEFASHGYERVAPPLVSFADDPAGGLRRGGGADTLRAVDPISGRTLGLRADLTRQVGRIATTAMAANPRPVRLSYAGPVCRLRAPDARPERQLTQAGAELIGADHVAAAVEVAGMTVDALAAAGVDGLTVDLTMPDLLDALAVEVPGLAAALDAKDVGRVAALSPHHLPLLDAVGPFDEAVAVLRAFDRHGALASRLEGLATLAAALAPTARVTLDPTERHGFKYQSWLGFSLFADGIAGELGRGGTYALTHPDGRREPATGVSLFLDPLVDAAAETAERRRLFLPLGHDQAAAARLRAEGWVTVRAFGVEDTAAAQCCRFELRGGEPVALNKQSTPLQSV